MKPHEEWLFKAEHDLQSAEFLTTSLTPLFDISIYHTQQCAEKSLKAFLAFKKQEIDKVHSLIYLNNMCIELDVDFREINEDLIFLNPYSTVYRYPEGELMPPENIVFEAISRAKNVYNFILGKITIG